MDEQLSWPIGCEMGRDRRLNKIPTGQNDRLVEVWGLASGKLIPETREKEGRSVADAAGAAAANRN
jgi:hypothetical protein